MKLGFLVVSISDPQSLPLENATVMIYEDSKTQSDPLYFTSTQKNGSTPVISLTTPPLYESFNKKGKKPYENYHVVIQAKNYPQKIIQNVQVFPTITSFLPVQMETKLSTPIDIKEHTLFIGKEPKNA